MHNRFSSVDRISSIGTRLKKAHLLAESYFADNIPSVLKQTIISNDLWVLYTRKLTISNPIRYITDFPRVLANHESAL